MAAAEDGVVGCGCCSCYIYPAIFCPFTFFLSRPRSLGGRGRGRGRDALHVPPGLDHRQGTHQFSPDGEKHLPPRDSRDAILQPHVLTPPSPTHCHPPIDTASTSYHPPLTPQPGLGAHPGRPLGTASPSHQPRLPLPPHSCHRLLKVITGYLASVVILICTVLAVPSDNS